jgi:hypothetical protein
MDNNDPGILKGFIQELKNIRSLSPGNRWWPKYFFHFTDLRNLINILDSGYLFSRASLEEINLSFVNGANSEIIKHTLDDYKHYARLYFRPRTPTLYRNEGIRPSSTRGNAHCPIPVYLFFDSVGILSRQDVKFSNGNLSRTYEVEIFDSFDDFRKLPFEDIYHHGVIKPQERINEVIFRRHAEIIVKEKLDLQDLTYIVCRSSAELELLRNSLSPEIVRKYGNRIHNDVKADIFNREWVYVNKVFLSSDHLIVNFNSPRNYEQDKGSFHIRVEIISSNVGVLDQEGFNVTRDGRWRVNFPKTDNYTVVIYLDGIIVYNNTFDSTVKVI